MRTRIFSPENVLTLAGEANAAVRAKAIYDFENRLRRSLGQERQQ